MALLLTYRRRLMDIPSMINWMRSANLVLLVILNFLPDHFRNANSTSGVVTNRVRAMTARTVAMLVQTTTSHMLD